MFQLLKETKIDFMKRRRMWGALSAVLVLASILLVAVRGVNLGIEFTGGTELQVKYTAPPDLGSIRSSLGGADLGNNVVTTIGDPKENEVYIRLGTTFSGEKTEDLTPRVVEALRSDEVRGKRQSGLLDLNAADEESIRRLLESSPDVASEDAVALSSTISERRKELAIFRSTDELDGLPGMTPQALDHLLKNAFVGPFSVRSQSYIGPTIGRELMQKALLAVLGSLGGMLLYIAFRFQLRYGVAAVIALVHDTLVTLGLFALFQKEMSLPVVAAFLTLVGYSVNDTVVIFDRIRENVRLRGTADFKAIINLSINQTLSRTILTSGLTWMVVLTLFLFAGEALNPFAFVLTIGILVGTYSTLYVASPVLLWWSRLAERRRRGGASPLKRSAQRKAKKVRSSATG